MMTHGTLPAARTGVSATSSTPFAISVEHCCVYSTRTRITVRARYDVETVRGPLCIVIVGEDGPVHDSCWEADYTGAPLVVRKFEMNEPGEFEVGLYYGRTLTAAAHILIQ